MLYKTIKAVGQLAAKVEDLTDATIELVQVTKALHRERAAQIRQEVEELDPDDHPKRNNFKTFHLMARLEALDMPVRTPKELEALDMSPRVPVPYANGSVR